jgi:hypothetical protein
VLVIEDCIECTCRCLTGKHITICRKRGWKDRTAAGPTLNRFRPTTPNVLATVPFDIPSTATDCALAVALLFVIDRCSSQFSISLLWLGRLLGKFYLFAAMAYNTWAKLSKAQNDYPKPKFAVPFVDKALKKNPTNPFLLVCASHKLKSVPTDILSDLESRSRASTELACTKDFRRPTDYLRTPRRHKHRTSFVYLQTLSRGVAKALVWRRSH